ncbi:hypothetical protein [Nocardia terpenica]|uniref:hypothetical protein n=1 Tax=Nocardia terpenica TaxID=455432 RepID=UPI0012FD3B6D|nr:hypothetical protein [Nocardia terpenica]
MCRRFRWPKWISRWRPPQAGFLAWIDFRDTGWGDDPADHLLTAAKVALTAVHRIAAAR